MEKVKEFIEEKEYQLNFKKRVNFRNPIEYLQIVKEFANGIIVGYIIFGVNDETNQIIGIKEIKKSYQEIIKNIRNHIKPNIEPIVKVAHIEEKNVILLKIIPEKEKLYQYDIV